MREHVTVVPADKCIIVDGEIMNFAFPAPSAMHALQWHEGAGHIEHKGGRPGRDLTPEDYETDVLPFVLLWEAALAPHMEKLRGQARDMVYMMRKSAEQKGFNFQGVCWGSGEKSEMRLTTALVSLGNGNRDKINGWQVSEGVYVTLTADLAAAALEAMQRHHNACFDVERAKKDEITRLSLPSELNQWMSTSLMTGWPE